MLDDEEERSKQLFLNQAVPTPATGLTRSLPRLAQTHRQRGREKTKNDEQEGRNPNLYIGNEIEAIRHK